MNNAYNLNDNSDSNCGCHNTGETYDGGRRGTQEAYWKFNGNNGEGGKIEEIETVENKYEDTSDKSNCKSYTAAQSCSSNSLVCRSSADFNDESCLYRKRTRDGGDGEGEFNLPNIYPSRSNYRINAYNNNNDSNNRKGGRGGGIMGAGRGVMGGGMGRNIRNSKHNNNITFDFSNQNFHCGSLDKDTEHGGEDGKNIEREEKDDNNNSEMKNAKIYLPEGIFHPTVNVIGVLLGPKGAHHKKMEYESKTSIQLYGKGVKNDNIMCHNNNNSSNNDTLYLSVNYFHLKQLYIVYNFLDELIAKTYPEDSPIIPPKMRRPPELNAFAIPSTSSALICFKQDEREAESKFNSQNTPERKVVISASSYLIPASSSSSFSSLPSCVSSSSSVSLSCIADMVNNHVSETFNQVSGVGDDNGKGEEEKEALSKEIDESKRRDSVGVSRTLLFSSQSPNLVQSQHIFNLNKTESNKNASSQSSNNNNNFSKVTFASSPPLRPNGGILPIPPRPVFLPFQNLPHPHQMHSLPVISPPFLPVSNKSTMPSFDMIPSFRHAPYHSHLNGGGKSINLPAPPTKPPSSLIQALWTFHLLLLYVPEMHVVAFNDTYVQFYGFKFDVCLFEGINEQINGVGGVGCLDVDGLICIFRKYSFIFLLRNALIVSTVLAPTITYEAFSDLIEQHISTTTTNNNNNLTNSFPHDCILPKLPLGPPPHSSPLFNTAQDKNGLFFPQPPVSSSEDMSINAVNFPASFPSSISSEFSASVSLNFLNQGGNINASNNFNKDNINQKNKYEESDQERKAKKTRLENEELEGEIKKQNQRNSLQVEDSSGNIKNVFELEGMEEIEEEEDDNNEEVQQNHSYKNNYCAGGVIEETEEREKEHINSNQNDLKCDQNAYSNSKNDFNEDKINSIINSSNGLSAADNKLVLMTLLQSLHRMLVKLKRPINVNDINYMFNQVYQTVLPLSLIKTYYYRNCQISSLYHFLQAFPAVFRLSRRVKMNVINSKNERVGNENNNYKNKAMDLTTVAPTYKPNFLKVVTIFIECGGFRSDSGGTDAKGRR